MHCDVAQETGSSHRICEDYGRCNNNSKSPFVIISDGCSDPRSPDTDFGARLLVKAAENFMLLNTAEYGKAAIQQAAAQASGIGLDPKCLDCTLMTARANEESIIVDVLGDGTIVSVKKNTDIEIIDISFPAGFPYYINYMLDQGRMDSFSSVSEKRITKYVISQVNDKWEKTETLATEYSKYYSTHYALEPIKYDYVAITTDGIGSFFKQTPAGQENETITSIISKLFNFKVNKGQFMQRRFNAFKSQCIKDGLQHHDDLTMGAIYVGK